VSDILLIHIGQGDARKTYEFSVSKLMNVEAIAIEKQTGLTVAGLLAGMFGKSAVAITAVVWVLRKRSEPRLRYDEVEFSIGDCDIEDPDEDEEEPAAEEQAAPKEPAKKAPRKRAAS